MSLKIFLKILFQYFCKNIFYLVSKKLIKVEESQRINILATKSERYLITFRSLERSIFIKSLNLNALKNASETHLFEYFL